MPLVTLTIRHGQTLESKQTILECIHAALVASGVPSDDRFQRVLELADPDFVYHPTYPDLGSPRSGRQS